jgi:hypothetical protein
MCFLYPLQLLSQTFLILRRIQQDIKNEGKLEYVGRANHF